MTDDFDEQKWIRAVRAEIDRSVETLPPATLAGLRQARRRAVQTVAAQPGWRAPAAVFATAAVVAVLLEPPVRPAQPEPPVEALDLLTGTAPLDLYDNLEFYEWLDADATTG